MNKKIVIYYITKISIKYKISHVKIMTSSPKFLEKIVANYPTIGNKLIIP